MNCLQPQNRSMPENQPVRFQVLWLPGTSSVDKVDRLELTKDESLEVGLVGQEILIWPGRPQYRHRLSRRLRSLSSDVRCVTPTCIGSGSGMVLHVTAEGGVLERRKGRLERIRLSMRIVSSINCSNVLPLVTASQFRLEIGREALAEQQF